jgi:excisionase family DNA binding protein
MSANIFGSACSAENSTPQSAECLLELLTVEEIAASLRVPPSWVYERVRRRGRDKMPHLKIGKYLRFRLNEVRSWIDQGATR